MNTTASSDDKILAALAHGSVILMFIGPIVPVVIWAAQRRKSNYVRFHALQAMGYQASSFWLWMLLMLLVMLAFLIVVPLSAAFMDSSGNAAVFPFLFQMLVFFAIFGLMGLSFLTGIVGAIACLFGRDFRYPFLGRRLERYLSYRPDATSEISETQEDNWVAGICHATAILQMWGVATPLIVWFSQKERSARLRFQSLQAFVYQMIALAVYMLGMVVYMGTFLAMFASLAIGGSLGISQELQGPTAFLMAGFIIVMMVFWLAIMLLMPVYFFLAGLASLRLWRGHNFRYPILGRLLERWIQPRGHAEPAA